jgi:plasmid replication initiation protein
MLKFCGVSGTLRRIDLDDCPARPHHDGKCLGCQEPTMTDTKQLALSLDSPLIGKVKNERNLMAYNFFSLEKAAVRSLPLYDDGTVRIEVEGNRYGVATLWDKELIIYLASLIHDKKNRGEPVSQIISFAAHDFCRVAQISWGGAATRRLHSMLRRLKGTTIYTNIQTGIDGQKMGAERGVNWIDDYQFNWVEGENGEKYPRYITVKLSDWLFQAIDKHKAILTYHPDYFTLTPLEKRLYEVARAHCGGQTQWAINIERLRRKVGSDCDLKKFKLNLVKMTKRKICLPEYSFYVVDQRKVGSLDPRNPPKQGRIPLKRYIVIFYRIDRIGRVNFTEVGQTGADELSDDFDL